MSAGYLQLIELVMVFGAVLAFGWWQLRSVERDRRKRLERELQEGRGSGNAASREGAGEKSD